MFALTILVIWVHSVNLEPEVLRQAGFSGAGGGGRELFALAFSAERFFTVTLGQTAVPGFFMVSAYLFFRDADRIETEREASVWLLGKWKRRIYSLLLPYLVWNLIYYLIYLAADSAAFRLFMANGPLGGEPYAASLLLKKDEVPLNLPTFLSAVFFYRYNPVFWYLYQLILLSVLAPAIGLLLRKRRTACVALFASFLLAVFWHRLPLHPVHEDALFYYMLGACAALRRKQEAEGDGLIRLFWELSVLLFGCALLVLVLFQLGFAGTAELSVLADVLWRAAFPPLLFAAASALCKKAQPDALPQFMRIGFFVYAVHYLMIKSFNILVFALLPKSALSDGSVLFLLCYYFLLPFLCVFSALLLGEALKRGLPGAWRLLSGGR